ncbi:MAG: HAD family hydrolase [Anaerolineae bacterium]
MASFGVIFDLGHTLMHLGGTWPEVLHQGAADLAAFLNGQGLSLDSQAFAQAFLDLRRESSRQAQETMREVTCEESMRRTFARFGLLNPDPGLVRGAIEAFFAYEETCWFADGEALPLLEELAGRRVRLGLFSNATDDLLIQRLVDRFGFRQWLDPVSSSARIGVRKPDPAAFLPILAHWNLPPHAVVMVGDTLAEDILGAQRVGLRSVWLRSREGARPEDPRRPNLDITPDAVIDRLMDLPPVLEKLWRRPP